MEYHIRQASEIDLNGILDLNRRVYFDSVENWKISGIHERYSKGMWWVDPSLLHWHFSILKKCEGGILVCEHNATIIAELDYVLTWEGEGRFKRVHIIWNLVDARFRRLGISKKLMQTLCDTFDLPVWVEAEDRNSDALYSSSGRIITTIINLSKQECTKNIDLDSKPCSLQELFLMVQKGTIFPILGAYYCSSFDTAQLAFPDPQAILYGNLPPPQVIMYKIDNIEYYVILTQYIRVYVQKVPAMPVLLKLLQHSMSLISSMGFESIEVQLYESKILLSALEILDFQELERDPVYQLSCI
ncbi:MAG: GNAT family N-acetyltransferase [Candidatus Heimdallarchaeota archaeon]|nr:GNAT family N-acetyltransferase [Candidatus Heimdallarchaeota archaeon]